MNRCFGSLVVVVWLIAESVAVVPQDRPAAARNEEAASCTAKERPDSSPADLVRATTRLAEETRAELARSREQNEALRQLLEQTRQEMARLREEVALLRMSMGPGRLGDATPTTAAKAARAGEPPSSQVAEKGESPASPGAAGELREQVEVNTAQIKELDQTKVESQSRFKVRLFGTLLSNTYFNTADTSQAAAPTEAPPRPASGPGPGHNLGATLRQTEFGFALSGPKVGAASLSADVDFDFFGGTVSAYDGNVLGTLRMRTAAAHLEGPRTSLAIGLMGPMISPLNPTSLAEVYYPALAESGNLWQWLPQVTVQRRASLSEDSDLLLQAGLMLPFGESLNGQALQGRPGYESRIAFSRRLDAERRMEIGIGGSFRRDLFGFGRSVDAYTATSDWSVPLSGMLELSGEGYFGRGITLSEHSGGNTSDAFVLSGPVSDPTTRIRGIHSTGGWAQLKFKPIERLEFNSAFGVDDPRDRDVFSGVFSDSTRLRNQTFSANSIYRLRSNVLLSLEYRHIRSAYPGATSTNDHINLAIGYLF